MIKTDRLLLTVAPCAPPYMAGEIPGLDLSPKGIADEVVRAYEAGANIAHLHVWDETGKPATDTGVFEQTIRLIRERCDIVIEGSTGGFNNLTPAERSTALNVNIEMSSLNPGSVNYDSGVYINSPSDIRYWTEEMARRNIKPDIAIFDTAMIDNSLMFAEESLIEPPFVFTFVMGQTGAIGSAPRNLMFLTESVPGNSFCFVASHTSCDIKMAVMNMSIGGHGRAGFEDSPYYLPGIPAKSNAQFIERLVRIGRELGREPASPWETREMLKLNTGGSE